MAELAILEGKRVNGTSVEDEQERCAAIRASLRGQEEVTRLSRAEAEFGLSVPLRELVDRVRGTLSCRPWRRRGARFTAVSEYQGRIPDEALLRYDAAKRSGMFSAFWIVEPVYFERQPSVDPWLVGTVHGVGHRTSAPYDWSAFGSPESGDLWAGDQGDTRRFIVLAYWD